MRRRRMFVKAAAAASLAGLALRAAVSRFRSTPLIDAAAEHIRREVAYTSRIAPELPREHLTALAVTSYVVGNVSAPAYGYRIMEGETVPTTAEQALATSAGICGEATALALALYRRLDVQARRIEAYWPGGGHATVEVWEGGRWRWFDPTFGYFYREPNTREVLGIAEVLDGGEAMREGMDALLWAQITRQKHVELGNGLDITGASAIEIRLSDGTRLYERGPVGAATE